jgi:hypothetical protein
MSDQQLRRESECDQAVTVSALALVHRPVGRDGHTAQSPEPKQQVLPVAEASGQYRLGVLGFVWWKWLSTKPTPPVTRMLFARCRERVWLTGGDLSRRE